MLRTVLPDGYYCHFLLLSGAMTLLLGYRISPQDLDTARTNLNWFLDLFEELYGKLLITLFDFLKKKLISAYLFNFFFFFLNPKNDQIALRWYSLTIHSIIHLVDDVIKFGPLWCYSTFPFESYYHTIRQMIHGTKHVLHQVIHPILTLFFFFQF